METVPNFFKVDRKENANILFTGRESVYSRASKNN